MTAAAIEAAGVFIVVPGKANLLRYHRDAVDEKSVAWEGGLAPVPGDEPRPIMVINVRAQVAQPVPAVEIGIGLFLGVPGVLVDGTLARLDTVRASEGKGGFREHQARRQGQSSQQGEHELGHGISPFETMGCRREQVR